MGKVFFIDEQHENNYKKLQARYPESLYSKEYQAACYIFATPMIFSKFEDMEFSSPVRWIYDWEDKYLPQGTDETDEAYEERTNIEANYDLSSSMQQMGKLALNLWGGYEHFNLMDCLASVDDKNILVVRQAIDIRIYGFANEEGRE